MINYDEIDEKHKYLYFKSGKQKQKYMKCHDPQYISELRRINGYFDPRWACAGNRCPYYSVGCDK